MDIELARTFLEIIHQHSFSRAAESLHLTQTTVTSRMQKLESQLGCRLMTRDRGGIHLTAQGESFMPYARQMLQTWENARQEVPKSIRPQSSLQIGGELSLWNPLLLEWLIWLRRALPDTDLRAHVEIASALVDKVLQAEIDIAVVYSPQYHPQLQVQPLLEETLIMVRSNVTKSTAEGADYISIDWGPQFNLQHEQTFPEHVHNRLSIGLGPLALQYILRAGGSGYFRTRAVQPLLDAGKLVRVDDAPEFMYPVYIVRMKSKGDDILDQALDGLQQTIANEDIWQDRVTR